MTGRRDGRRGFTLLEVLLSVALILMLIGAMSGFLLEVVERRGALAQGARDIEAAGAFIERIEADMLAGLAGGAGIGAGVSGTETTLKLLTRGVQLSSGEAADAGDMQAHEFVFEPNVPRLTARRQRSDQGKLAAAGAGEVISDRFERVRFRYYDGRGWRGEFDSMKEGTLPVAIEVCVWITSVGNSKTPVRSVRASKDAGTRADAGAEEGERASEVLVAGGANLREEPEDTGEFVVWGEPSRRRVIVVPDGPEADWSDAR